MSAVGIIVRNICSKKWSFPPQIVRNDYARFSSKVEIPLPPKRPLTAYMIFCKENRKEVRKENPDLSNPEQVRKLAEKWSKLNEEAKKPFEIMARERTLIYGEEHKKFYENLSEEQKIDLAKYKAEKKMSRQLSRLKKALKEAGLPKTPASSAYTCFIQSISKDNKTNTNPQEFIKEAATQWKSLSEDKKKLYEAQVQEQKAHYLKEMEQFRNKLLREGKLDLLNEYNELKGNSEMNEVISTQELKVKRKAKTTSMELK